MVEGTSVLRQVDFSARAHGLNQCGVQRLWSPKGARFSLGPVEGRGGPLLLKDRKGIVRRAIGTKRQPPRISCLLASRKMFLADKTRTKQNNQKDNQKKT